MISYKILAVVFLSDISHHHIDGTGRKPGFISFITKKRIEYEILFFKFIGPSVIVASFVFSSLYLIRILSAMLKYYLIADLVLDLMEAFFYCGVSVFLSVTNLWRSMEPACAETNHDSAFPLGNTISSIAVLVLCLIIPILVTRGSP